MLGPLGGIFFDSHCTLRIFTIYLGKYPGSKHPVRYFPGIYRSRCLVLLGIYLKNVT